MKWQLFILPFGLYISASIAQVPNGNFEEWQTLDSIENPDHWETNNYYVGYYPVAKTSEAIEGTYSMKVSSTARDLGGGATGYGCAHVKFVPSGDYLYLTASVRVDTVDLEGEASIRVKQWNALSGLYEKIGTWKDTSATNGVKQIILPIEQTVLDTLLIEVWAKNHYDPFTGNIGYTEIIIDELQLTNTVAAQEQENNFGWEIYPNPMTDAINIRLQKTLSKPCTLRIFDLHGRSLQVHDFPTLSAISLPLADISPGIYLLELTVEGEIKHIEKFVVKK